MSKFQLRNFSFQDNEKQIGLYNLKSSLFYPTATLDDQGYKKFFYGRDGKIEDELASIEGYFADLIKEIITTKSAPKKDSPMHLILLAFVGISHLRNPVAIEGNKKMVDSIRNHFSENFPTTDIERSMPKFSQEDEIELTFSNLFDIIVSISDLDCKVLINNTNTPFIFSDFPVIRYNMFLELKKWPSYRDGYSIAGLQIFVPLSSKISIVLFDPKIYKVGFKNRLNLEIDNYKCIDKLNELQVLNSFENVYFNHEVSKKYITNLVEGCKKYQKPNQIILDTGYLYNEDTKTRYANPKDAGLLISKSTYLETKLEINGIKIHSGASNINILNNKILIRKNSNAFIRDKYQQSKVLKIYHKDEK
ncbi:DUF4238 domain-containing protein [Runella aurantiaca]|uniref:DUF4238 domain-containing protein n=1 Tax=Runella aurantiaca TaxID=2282308 RepID=UPI001E33D507|nr:DUF4238 domain-containing protein [Runella aurantiaca]